MIERSSTWVSLGLLLAACRSGTGAPPESAVETPRSATGPSTDSTAVTVTAAEARSTLCQLLRDRDRDGDRRITKEDATKDTKWPYTVSLGGRSVELSDQEEASRLVQQLAHGLALGDPASEWVAAEPRDTPVHVDLETLRMTTPDYLLLQIESRFWDGLTRRIEPASHALERALRDEKMDQDAATARDVCAAEPSAAKKDQQASEAPPTSTPHYLYVPASDPDALAAFRALQSSKLVVGDVPAAVDADWVDRLTREDRHGLLSLALTDAGRGEPFVVPGGRFNEMYGWDSFFIAWGLSHDPSRVDLARSMVTNFVYQIEHYGKILNANRTYYLTRSQPPFLTAMIEHVWGASSAEYRASSDGKRWLNTALRAARTEYESVWTSPPRRTSLCRANVCLSRYFGEGHGQPPEVESKHFDWLYQAFTRETGLCPLTATTPEQGKEFVDCARGWEDKYVTGDFSSTDLDSRFTHDRCMRESGHDTTYRWVDAETGRNRCADFATVDLNALLLRTELDFAAWAHRMGGAQFGTVEAWCQRARERSELIREYLWDNEAGAFFDYDMRKNERSRYLAATTLYPLWAVTPDNACGVRLLDPEEVARLVATALEGLEEPGGLAGTSPGSLAGVPHARLFSLDDNKLEEQTLDRQWDHPNGWAPHQMLAWSGLRAHGHLAEADRLTYKWLYTIARNAADYHGTVPEKFDVVTRSHKVFQEYGNVNTEFAYITEEGFGWMNASFVVGWSQLGERIRSKLSQLAPPEPIDFGARSATLPEQSHQ